jgi:hypothetical protein
MLTTTLAEMKKHEFPYLWEGLLEDMFARLGAMKADDSPLTLERLSDICDWRIALWALRAVDGHRNAMRLFLCRCAEYSLNFFGGFHLKNDEISSSPPLTWNLANKAIVKSTMCRVFETTIDFRLNLANQWRCRPLFLSIATVPLLPWNRSLSTISCL